MASYVSLIEFRDQSIRSIQDTVKRDDAAGAEAQKIGMATFKQRFSKCQFCHLRGRKGRWPEIDVVGIPQRGKDVGSTWPRV